MRAALQLARGRPQGRGALEGVPDALAHGGRAGRHRRLARQHGRGQLALAHVRHRQGLGLPRRPGRDRVHVPHGAARWSTSSSTSACRSTATPTARSTSARSAATRATSARSRCSARARRPTAPATRCCTRSTSATCARARSSSSSGWRSTSSATPTATCSASIALEMETGEVMILAGEGHAVRHRRRGAHLRRQHQRVHQHRRRPRHGGARRHSARGHGVLAVPPDRRRRRRRADHRGRARRGRLSCSTRTASASWSATRRP